MYEGVHDEKTKYYNQQKMRSQILGQLAVENRIGHASIAFCIRQNNI